MTVAEAQARMTEAEFQDWLNWFEWRNDMEERAREGRSLADPAYAEDMTPEESAKTLMAFAAQFNARSKKD